LMMRHVKFLSAVTNNASVGRAKRITLVSMPMPQYGRGRISSQAGVQKLKMGGVRIAELLQLD